MPFGLGLDSPYIERLRFLVHKRHQELNSRALVALVILTADDARSKEHLKATVFDAHEAYCRTLTI